MFVGGALTPLCPAGHLPLKGGDWLAYMASPIIGAGDWGNRSHRVISPLEGEMAGKPEGVIAPHIRHPGKPQAYPGPIGREWRAKPGSHPGNYRTVFCGYRLCLSMGPGSRFARPG